jgi:L-asparaginase II
MPNPVLIELTRGSLLESSHAGTIAVVRTTGERICSVGDVARPVFPRSAIKPMQAVPFLESGAAERFGFGAAEIALASGSHTGTQRHIAIAETMLERAGLKPAALSCGVHEPIDGAAARELVRAGRQPTTLHHNCSGKHAAMLATAVHMGEPTQNYWRPDHPVEVRIRRVLEDLGGNPLGAEVCGIDGCSVPNWAVPLERLALAFARFATGTGLSRERGRTCRRIAEACWANPELVAGPGRLDTRVMEKLPGKVLVKAGAEGVYVGALPERRIGFALKIDDGAKRAAEAVVARLIAGYFPETAELAADPVLRNWNGLEVGTLTESEDFRRLLAQLI